jgi:FSR family fosmidomycin resistance protein-like MFS transporter
MDYPRPALPQAFTMTTLVQPATSVREEATVVGLVGLAHGISHFSQLLLAPLFPWLKDEFVVSYAQLGFLLTIFFTVSCVVQAASGFWVDRYGPRPVLLAGLAMLIAWPRFGFAPAPATGCWRLFVLAGAGNGVFHPVDYTLINRKVGKARLGHAYSVHGITGSLGWALAPAMLVPLTMAYSWRVALVCARALAFAVLALLLWRRADLDVPRIAAPAPAVGAGPEHVLAFLRLPRSGCVSGSSSSTRARCRWCRPLPRRRPAQLHGVPPHWRPSA